MKSYHEKLTPQHQKEIELFSDYLYKNESSENTIKIYTYALAIYFSLFKKIDKYDLLNFKKYLMENFKPETVNVRISGINHYLAFKGKADLKLKNVKLPRRSFDDKMLSYDDYTKFLHCVKQHSQRYYFITKFLAYTGARISELLQFKKEHLEQGYIELYTKGKIRRIHIPSAIIEESKTFFKHEKDFLFKNRMGERITSRAVTAGLKYYAKKSGVPEELIHPHNFRHFFAIQFLKKTKDVTLLSDLLGHSSVDMTALYARVSAKEQRQALERAIDW
ncbi:tyrosine-type recombinase/integrase [Gallibacterium salpingitidis]|uniref:tyrosine-type recombinase/integrase n=1 Tax=Gallibacterium salpingitidis TaxID=505341 RepID=UPI002670A4C3|nr:tyrosine-type recombinase/integrase [Gallibacterium salpingitidis]WKT00496.1 tyrosine-type recombinase/integrase [Gallibacterium salpingitidis]